MNYNTVNEKRKMRKRAIRKNIEKKQLLTIDECC